MAEDPRKDSKKNNSASDKHGSKHKNASKRHDPDFKDDGRGDAGSTTK